MNCSRALKIIFKYIKGSQDLRRFTVNLLDRKSFRENPLRKAKGIVSLIEMGDLVSQSVLTSNDILIA